MVVFGIPRLVHPFNPEYQPTFCFKILNPNLQIRGGGGGRIVLSPHEIEIIYNVH